MTLTGFLSLATSRQPRFLGFASASFLLFSLATGCSVSTSRAPADETAEPTSEASAGTPLPEATAAGSGPSCTPDIGGFVAAGIAPLSVTCPERWLARPSTSLPVSGRFTSREELTKAYCVPLEGEDDVPPGFVGRATDAIDFSESDVVAYAYDSRGGQPTLLRRGAQLWLERTTDACSGRATSLAGVAFVVPKSASIDERTCSRRCD